MLECKTRPRCPTPVPSALDDGDRALEMAEDAPNRRPDHAGTNDDDIEDVICGRRAEASLFGLHRRGWYHLQVRAAPRVTGEVEPWCVSCTS